MAVTNLLYKQGCVYKYVDEIMYWDSVLSSYLFMIICNVCMFAWSAMWFCIRVTSCLFLIIGIPGYATNLAFNFKCNVGCTNKVFCQNNLIRAGEEISWYIEISS